MAENKNKSKEKWAEIIPTTEKTICEEDVKKENPWSGEWGGEYVEESVDIREGYHPRSTRKMLLKRDAYFINQFNEKHKGTDYEFILHIFPCPFGGNPLKAKVIALSLNPGYDYRSNYLLQKIMPAKIEEAVKRHALSELNLEANSFMCTRDKPLSNSIDCRDAQNMLGGWYWYDILERFRKEAGLPSENDRDDVIYNNFALIQYIPYHSKAYKGLSDKVILPSQRFTRLLIHHIAKNRKDVIFVVSRSENLWRKLIGEDFWKMLEKENRLVHRKLVSTKKGTQFRNRTQSFTRTSFEDDGFDRIVNAFKQCM